MRTLADIALGVAAFAAGALLAFFGVLNALFSDGSFAEKLGVAGFVLLAFGMLGLLLGGAWPDRRWLPWISVVPVVIVGIGYPVLERGGSYLFALAAVMLAAAALGVWLGSRVGRRLRGA